MQYFDLANLLIVAVMGTQLSQQGNELWSIIMHFCMLIFSFANDWALILIIRIK
jgi:hypothetical protein